MKKIMWNKVICKISLYLKLYILVGYSPCILMQTTFPCRNTSRLDLGGYAQHTLSVPSPFCPPLPITLEPSTDLSQM